MAAMPAAILRGRLLAAWRNSSGLAFSRVTMFCSAREGCRPRASITLMR